MGLFSFVGKALKGISKVAGFIPGIGGTISKITGGVGNLLDHKAPLATSVMKMRTASYQGPAVLRGNTTQAGSGSLLTAQGMRSSPVLPGGAVSTSSGIAPKMASPPRTFGGRSGTSTKRRRTKAKARKRSTRKTSSRRKLKFGSAAYRKKYLKHRR